MTVETKNLNILIYNSDLPVFPGAGSHEFLNTTQLALRALQLGLVSMAHTEEDLRKAEELKKHNVNLYLWKAPHLLNETPSSSQSPVSVIARSTMTKPYRSKQIKKIIWNIHGRILHWAHRQVKKISKRPDDLFYTDKLFRHLTAPLSQALSDTDWQVCIVIQSSAADVINYLPKGAISVLVMHDIRSLVFKRQADIEKGAKKRYLSRQAKRYFNHEKKYCNQFDLIIALSQYDRDWIETHYQPKQVAIVPIPIDLQYFKLLPTHLSPVPNRIVFTGHMAHPPNIDAAIYFAREIFPFIKNEIDDAEFFIVGKSPSEEVRALAALPGVTVTGQVPDTRDYLSQATVVVVPLRFGSGVRNKILEAWGLEKCIISTPIGAEGLKFEKDKDLIIAENSRGLIDAVLHALRSPEYRQQVSKHGRLLAEKYHCPASTGQRYYQEIAAIAQAEWSRKKTMHLAIDIRWMVPGLAGGIENVARSFINELNRVDSPHQYTLMINPQCQADFKYIDHANIQLLCQRPFDIFKHHLKLNWGKICSKLRIEHFYLPNILDLRFLNKLNADMIYSFPGYVRPEFYAASNILMVPDIQHEYLPEFFPEAVLEERKRIYGESIKKASHLCAISEFTRKTLIEKLNIHPNQITTIHLAADPSFHPNFQEDEQQILDKYHLSPNRYLFFPAHTWHHKNHLAAIKALKILRDKYQFRPQLVCTGGAREAQLNIEKCIVENDLQRQVRFLGYCSRKDLPVLYRQAIALVYPSLFEGFGMPVLEAMKSGCPVVCSNTTSLPEIAGNAAILINPDDHEALADAIFNLVKDPSYREALKPKGLQQAAKFSWAKHTRETLALFDQVFANLRYFS